MVCCGVVRDGLVFTKLINLRRVGEEMIVCICNGLKDKDIQDICDSCKTKEEFAECLKMKMNRKSCHSCYSSIIENFKREKMNE